MVSFKYMLIFIALIVYAVTADEPRASGDGKKVKKHAYIAAAPVPHFAFPAPTYPYMYAAYPRYVLAYNSHAHDGSKYWPRQYGKVNLHGAYNYPRDAGKYWPGKYGKTYLPAHKTAAYPITYHY